MAKRLVKNDIGKFLMKLRIDFDETMGRMAKKIGVSHAFLSLAESGKRNMSIKTVRNIIDAYDLKNEQKDELIQLLLKKDK